MKKKFIRHALRGMAIIAFIAVIGFSMLACKDNDDTEGSGKFTGKDIVGNTYTLSVGSDASRAAKKDDKVNMDIKTRGGTVKQVKGKVKDIKKDGTMIIQPDNGGDDIAINTDGENIESVITEGDLPNPILRTFDTINLRASRWEDNSGTFGEHWGEHWGSGMSVLERDFPTNVSRLYVNKNYTLTISGTTDTALPKIFLEVQGLTADNKWVYLGGYQEEEHKKEPLSTSAGTFNKTVTISIVEANTLTDNFGKYHDLTKYKEIILQFTNVIHKVRDGEVQVDNGRIDKDDLDQYKIMATISNFNISLKDKDKAAGTGNMGDWTYQNDGEGIIYMDAKWSLSSANVATAKQKGKFEFIIGNGDISDILDRISMAFYWQDPVRELWCQDLTDITKWDDVQEKWIMNEGAAWDSSGKKITIDLSKFIKDSQFNSTTQLNFIIVMSGYHKPPYSGDWIWDRDELNIDILSITGANVLAP